MVSVPESGASTSTSGTGLVSTIEAAAVSSPPLKIMPLTDTSSTAPDLGEPPLASPNDTLEVQETTLADKRKRFPLPVRPACPRELFKNKFQCQACPNDSFKEYSLSEFFIHQFSTHGIISCIYCDEEFQFARDVMSHLYREHHLKNQKFENDEEFLRRGGGRTTVFCIECNIMLKMSPDTDQDILSNHECLKPSSCGDCGLLLEDITIEEHSAVCNHEGDGSDSLTKLYEEQGICRFCKGKLQRVNGQLVCSLCEKIGIHNLIMKSPPIPVKSSPFVSHLPPIRNPSRKTTKALPPLLPANFGNTSHANFNSIAPESFIPRSKKISFPLATKSRPTVSQTSSTFNSELSRMNFSSSITVTALHSSPGDDTDNQDTAGIATNHKNHSNITQENTDLSRPRRSLKRVTHEDFMYDNQLKRRVSNSTVSITPVPPYTQGRTYNNRRMSMSKSRNRGATPTQPTVTFDYDSAQNEAENGLFDNCEGGNRLEEAESQIPEVKLDPLLLEPDPKERITLLINELAQVLLENLAVHPIGEAGTNEPSNALSIAVSQNSSDDAILNQMIDKSSAECDYCRQVKIIRIDKRQLTLHLLRKHAWVCRRKGVYMPKVENVQPVKEEKSGDEQKEVNDTSEGTNVIVKVETFSLVKNENVDGEKMKDTNAMTVSPEKMDCAMTKDEAKCDLYEKGKESSESKSEQSTKEVAEAEIKLEGTTNSSLCPTSEEADVDLTKEIDVSTKEFYLDLLRKVFESEKIVFSYKPPHVIPFGEIPCECLICGFTASSQVNLFPHWRKAHRSMAMKCPMCLGKFLFAGALFSHICLGTPQHFLSTSAGGKVGTAGVPESHHSGDLECTTEEGTSNDTIFLRYQCGTCDDLQLPGFFNYMVHLRRDHHRCELCLENVSNDRELEHHIKKHKLNHFCWKCSITYLSKSNLLTHLFWKHGTESRECSICLEKKWPHIYHFCIPPPWFTCDVCGLYFTKSKSLLVHMRLHSREKLRSCQQCKKEFISAPLLRKHMAAAHEKAPEVFLSTGSDFKLNGCESEESEDDAVKEMRDNKILSKVEEKIDKDEMLTVEKKVTDVDEVDNVMIPNNETESNSEQTTATDDVQPTDEVLEKKEQIKDTTVAATFVEKAQKVPDSEANVTRDPVREVTDDLADQYSPSPRKRTKKFHKKGKNKRRKHSKFKIGKIIGPNLSEDEGSSSSSSSSTSENENIERVGGTASSISSESDLEMFKQPGSPDPLAEPLNASPAEPKTSGPLKEFVSPKKLAVADTLELLTPTPSKKTNSSPSLYCPFEGMTQLKQDRPKIVDLSGSTPRLDLSSTATAMLFDEKSILETPLSPLLHPLDEFNLTVPEIPTFDENALPDHISRENALRSILNEHDYCMPRHVSVVVCGSLKRKSTHGVVSTPKDGIQFHVPTVTPAKKLKVLKPEPKAAKTVVGKKRKRNKSLSSSSSSSSCSSCGSNCSCSSGTSSSSSSDSDSSDSSDSESNSDTMQRKANTLHLTVNTVQSPKLTPTPQPRGRKPKPKIDQPAKVRKPKGRPPKANKRIKPAEVKPIKGDGLGDREVEILKHFADPNDAFILEEDLDTADSDADDIFHKKQLSESIIPIIPLLDDPWTAGNEKFLLKEVKGVKELEELRPKPLPPKPKVINSQTKIAIKPLILRPSFGNIDDLINENDANMSVMIGNTRITGKGSLQTSLSSNSNKTTITISRGTVTAATAIPASALVKGKKKLKPSSETTYQKPAAVCSYVPPSVDSQMKSASQGQASPVTPLSNPSTLTEASAASTGISQTASSTPSPVKARRARMKVTDRKSKAPDPIPPPLTEVYELTEPDEKLYCICQGPHDNVSQMIGCDADDCPYQWFHFECVGIVVAPKGKWFCQDCRDKRRKKAFQGKEGGHGDASKTSVVSIKSVDRGRQKGFTNNTFIGHTVS